MELLSQLVRLLCLLVQSSPQHLSLSVGANILLVEPIGQQLAVHRQILNFVLG